MKQRRYFGDRDEIALCGPVTHNQQGMLVLRAYNGMREPDGQKQVVSFVTATADLGIALAKANEFLNHLRAAWDKAHARVFGTQASVSEPTTGDAPSASNIKTCVENIFAELESQFGSGPALNEYRQEAMVLMALLGEAAQWLPEQISLQKIALVRDLRLGQLDPQSNAPRKCMESWRFILERISGISQECLSAIRIPNRKPGS